MIPFMGVRISWLMVARNAALAGGVLGAALGLGQLAGVILGLGDVAFDGDDHVGGARIVEQRHEVRLDPDFLPGFRVVENFGPVGSTLADFRSDPG